jgi:hypothetical protein
VRGKVRMHVHVDDRLALLRGGREQETGKNSDDGKGSRDREVCHEAHEVPKSRKTPLWRSIPAGGFLATSRQGRSNPELPIALEALALSRAELGPRNEPRVRMAGGVRV